MQTDLASIGIGTTLYRLDAYKSTMERRWEAHVVMGETSASWIIAGGKINKKTMRLRDGGALFYTEEERLSWERARVARRQMLDMIAAADVPTVLDYARRLGVGE